MHALKQLWSRLSPRQRKFAFGSTAVAVLFGLVFGVMVRGEDARAVASTLRNPMSIFASRSPGARLDGVLLQTKPKLASKPRSRERPIGLVPQERVLSAGRARPASSLALAPDFGPQIGLLGGPAALVATPGFDVPAPIGPGFDVPGFGFGGTPGFAGAPGIPPGTDGPVPGGPGAAVPETSTWLMMIIGLGAAGMALRRRRAPPRAASARG